MKLDLLEICQKALSFYYGAEDKSFGQFIPPDELSQIIDLNLSDEAQDASQIESFVDDFFRYSINTLHKSYMNQLWSKVEAPSLAGEILTSFTNTSMYTYEVAPVVTLMEHAMVDKLGEIVWGENSHDGIMTSGGSASNFQALLLARQKYFPHVKEEGYRAYGDLEPVVLCASNAHYSIRRSLNLIGLGCNSLIEVKVNEQGQICLNRLASIIVQLKNLGKTPFMLISTAGTTVEGAYDDLKALGEICKREKLWFHIDGAYGASVLLSQKYHVLMNGVEACDSLSWDFHKMLGINMTCAFLLTKEKGLLKRALTTGNDSYLFHEDEGSYDLGPKSIQCGRRADIPKLWLTWQSLGRFGLGDRVDRLIEGARNLAEMISAHEGFELIRFPQSMNICFRPLFGSVEKIREQMLQDGSGMINFSHDEKGAFFRVVISRPDFSPEDFMLVIEKINQIQSKVISENED